MSETKTPMERHAATYTFDEKAATVGNLYYFAPAGRVPGPYLTQRHVEAIIDIAADGTLAGVELIDNMPPPPACRTPVVGAGWQPIDGPESLAYALEIGKMGVPYKDYQGQLYMNSVYKTDEYRDAEFRDYGLTRAVRIILNNIPTIQAALAAAPPVNPPQAGEAAK